MRLNRRREQRLRRRSSFTFASISSSNSSDSISEIYSAALIRYSKSDDPSVRLLKAKITGLQSQLKEMNQASDALRQDYEQKCSKSLQASLAGLLIVSDTVGNADKQLIFWYEKGKVLKVMLKPLGINKKTSAIVERKTVKLKSQVATVEHQFMSTSSVCKEALTEVQTLNRRVNEYSQSGIGGVQDKVTDTLSTFDEKKRHIEAEIKDKEVESSRVSANIDDTNAGICRTNEARTRADDGKNNATAVAFAGFGGALLFGAFAFVCAPVAIVAGAAAIAGTTSTIAAVSLNDEVNELEAVERSLSSKLSGLESEIRLLHEQLPELERQKSSFADASFSVKALEFECLTLRKAARELSSLLLKDRELLSHARMRVEKIASDLRSIEYTKTRRHITGRLLEILQDLGHVGATRKENAKQLEKAVAVVRRIEAQSPKILMILERAQ